ncbi:MAG: DNA repair protein RadC [Prevotella sp.]|nr:DNA repair protein RadC [Prevotella sp.]MDY4217751.1 DNA repair protein RadC [Prevotella sp.]
MEDSLKNTLKIQNLPTEDRPREKLERLGASTLSNAELLAILIGSGTPKESAVSLMQRIMNDCKNSLNTLGKMGIEELQSYAGIGFAKAMTILAACELGKRRQAEGVVEREQFDSAMKIYRFMHTKMQDLDVEQARILLLNRSLKLIAEKQISHGGITETSIDVRIILKEALLKNATAIVLCHNHPSNQTQPSREDDKITESLKKACDCMRIHFLDHIIVTDGYYYSYREEGRVL